MTLIAGDSTQDWSRLIDITQANDSNENSTVLNIANTANAGTTTSGTRTIQNASLTVTPTITLTSSGGTAVADVRGVDNNVSLANITFGDKTGSIGGRTNGNFYGNKVVLTVSPTINNTTGLGGTSDTINAYGENIAVSGAPTLTSVTEAVTLNSYGINIANSASSAGNSLLGYNAYGMSALSSGDLTTTGTTAHYAGYFTTSGTADNNYGLYVSSVADATNNYGLYLNTVASGSTNYSIYNNAAAQSYLGTGNVGIGDTTPSSLLTVGNGDLFQVSSAGLISTTPSSNSNALTITGTSVTSASLINLDARNTSGTIFNLAYGASTTIAGDTTGLYVDLNSGNVVATNQNLTGVNFKIPTVTNTITTGTKTLTGMLVNFGSGSGINQNGAGGTLEYIAGDFQMPALTQTAGTLNAYGLKVTTPSTITTGGTAYGSKIVATGVGAGTLYGMSVDNITGGAGTEYAYNVAGTGWDAVLRVGSTTVINGSGVTQVVGGGTGLATVTQNGVLYGNAASALGVTAAGTTGQVLIGTTGSAPSWGTISGSSCTNCLVTDPSSTQTVAPTGATTTGLSIRQTSTALGGNTPDIFSVASSDGATKYFYVDYQGNVSTGAISNTTLTLTPTTNTTALTLVGTNVTSAKNQYINTKNSSGTIFDLSYGAAQTLGGTIIGGNYDLSTNVTATNQSVSGQVITLPAATNTSGTQNYKGLVVTGGALNENGGTATNYYGADITIPALTGTSGTLTAYGMNVNTPSSITTAGTAYGVNVTATGVGAGTLSGVNISSITGGAGTEYGLQIGSGWDSNLYLNDTTSRVLLADGGTIVIHDGTNTLCTITDSGTTGDLSCTGNITGGSGGTAGFWSRSSTTLSPATANDIVSIANTTTSGADLAVTNTGVYTGTGLVATTANSATSGDIVTISATGLTTGTALTLTGPSSTGVTDHFVKVTADVGSASSLLNLNSDFSGSAVTGYGIYNTGTDSTSAANTDYGYYGSLALTGNAAKTGVGSYSTVTSSSTTGDTLVALDATSSVTGILGGATTRNVYGLRSQPGAGAESTSGTTNVFGVYSKADGDVGAGGTVNAYGLYVANGAYDTDGSSTAYGLYIEALSGADNNYGGYIGSNLGIGDTTPAAALTVGNGDKFQVASTGNVTLADGVLMDLSGINDSATTEGLLLPQNTDCTTATAEGQICWDSDNDILRVGNGATTTAWTASVWSSLTNPTTSLSLTFDDAEVNTFTVSSDTEDFWTIDAASMTTGSLFVLTGPTATGVTDNFVKVTSDVGSGAALVNLAPDFSGSAVTGYGLRIQATDSTANANANYGLHVNMALSGNAAKTAYGIFTAGTDTSTTADSIIGIEAIPAVSGAISTGTRSVWGLIGQPTVTAANTGGTTQTIGLQGNPIVTGASSGSANNVYGLLSSLTATAETSSTATINAYGLMIQNGTMSTQGTSTQTGLYVQSITGADNNYAAVFAGGNVGIGDTAPAELLTLSSTTDADLMITTVATGDNSALRFRRARDSTAVVADGDTLGSWYGAGYDGDQYLDATRIVSAVDGTPGNNDMPSRLTFFTVPDGSTTLTERMRIESTGEIGIGTSAPTSGLQIHSTSTDSQVYISSAAPRLGFGDNETYTSATNRFRLAMATGANQFLTGLASGDAIIFTEHVPASGFSSGEGDIVFATASNNSGAITARMKIDGAGNVGIGNTDPSAVLSITASGDDTSPVLQLRQSGTTNYGLNVGVDNAVDGSIFFSVLSNGTPTQVMQLNRTTNEVIFPATYVGVGVDPSAPLHVKSGAIANTIQIDTTSTQMGLTFAEGGTQMWNLQSGTSDASRFYVVDNDTNDGVYIAQDATSWTANSDIRLKENVSTIDNALDKVLNMRGVKYNFIGNSNREIGVIAQEVEPYFPELVNTDSEYWGVTYDRIAPVLIEAIKDLNGKVDNIAVSNGQFEIDSEGYLQMGDVKMSKIQVSSDVNVGGLVKASGFMIDASGINLVGALASVQPDLENKVSLAEAINSINAKVVDTSNKLDLLEASSSAQIAGVQVRQATASAELLSHSAQLASAAAELAKNKDSIASLRDDVSQLKLTPPSTLVATGSGQFTDIAVTNRTSTLALDALDATISGTLKSLGQTFLGTTTVAGDLSVDGTFSVTGNSINALTTLFIQNNPLSNLVDFFNGKATIDKNGRIAVESLALGDQSVGKGIIPAGATEVTIPTNAVSPTSHIFLTPTTDLAGGLVVGPITAGTSFKVILTQPNLSGVSFNWLIVGAK